LRNKTIVIKDITSAVIDGNTYYYIMADDEIYSTSIKTNKNLLPVLKAGDKIKISYNEGDISQIIKVEKEDNNE